MRIKNPDKKNSESLIQSAEKEMNFTLSLKISSESSSTIVRNIYECFRKIGDAILITKGKESRDHIEPLKELMSLQVKAERPLGVLENLRQIRHNINYYGYTPQIAEVEDTIDIAKTLFKPLLKEAKKIISE